MQSKHRNCFEIYLSKIQANAFLYRFYLFYCSVEDVGVFQKSLKNKNMRVHMEDCSHKINNWNIFVRYKWIHCAHWDIYQMKSVTMTVPSLFGT